MSTRSYDQYCGAARALDVVGERWALLVVRDLLLGPKRYTDLQSGLPGIGPNVLSARLRGLVDAGVVQRRTLPPPGAATVYELTALGEELRPVVRELVRWGQHLLGEPPAGEQVRLSWLVVAMEASFRPELARGLRETYEYRIDGEVFHVVIDDGTCAAHEGEAPEPTFAVTTDLETFLATATQQIDPEQAIADGRMTFSGDLEAGRRSVEILGVPFTIDGPVAAAGGLLGAMKAAFARSHDAGIRGTLQFVIDGRPVHLVLADDAITAADGAPADPDVTVRCDLDTFIAMGTGGDTAVRAFQEGRIEVDGDLTLAAAMAAAQGRGMIDLARLDSAA